MAQTYDIYAMAAKIEALKQTAAELKAMSNGIQAIDRNVDRILASIRMLEMNLSDVAPII